MRKINLKNYTVKLILPNPANPLEEMEVERPFFVKTSILNVMFAPSLMLSNADVVRENILAMKLEQCKDDEILLEENEYNRLKKAFDTFRGFDRNAVELVTRIDEAEVVEIK